MSGMSLPVQRPAGQALLVAGPGNRAQPLDVLRGLGYGATEADDPYAAMAELCRRPLVYRAVILSLASLYREELTIIASVKARFPHVEVWLTHTDGRQAVLAEAMRLGADGLLADDGLHRIAGAADEAAAAVSRAASPPEPFEPTTTEFAAHAGGGVDDDASGHDDASHDPPGPVLTADELRALLHEQPSVPHEDD
jgi:hypothetical protein